MKEIRRSAEAMLGALLRTAYFGQRLVRLITRPQLSGVVALVVAPDGRLVLVRHRYNAGWHLPGGHVNAGEALADAILRELAEEIAAIPAHPPVALETVRVRSNGAWYDTTIFVVHVQAYRTRPNLEIAAITAFAVAAVPSDARLGRDTVATILQRHGPNVLRDAASLAP